MMVQVEGSGKKAPAPHEVALSAGDIRQLIPEAKRRSEFRGYAGRPDPWGAGLVNAIVIPGVASIPKSEAPIVAGLVGEHVVRCLINKHCKTDCPLDLALLAQGDGGRDLVVNGVRIDVKTRTKDKDSIDTFYVRKFASRPNCDVFVFASWNRGLTAHVHGWMSVDDVLQCRTAPGVVGNHTNYEIEPEQLLPMSRLFADIRSRTWR